MHRLTRSLQDWQNTPAGNGVAWRGKPGETSMPQSMYPASMRVRSAPTTWLEYMWCRTEFFMRTRRLSQGRRSLIEGSDSWVICPTYPTSPRLCASLNEYFRESDRGSGTLHCSS